jgi:hypothetical protein
MIFAIKRYVADTRVLRVHDLGGTAADCNLDEIPPERRRWYESLGEAEADLPYTSCEACLADVKTDR